MIEKIAQNFTNFVISLKQKNDLIEVIAKSNNLEDVSKLTRQIYDFVDEIDATFWEKNQLDVSSCGHDLVIDIKNISEFIEQKLVVICSTVVNKRLEYIGHIIEYNKQSLIIKWNAKGQFRKQEILWTNIKEIKLYY